MEACGTGDLQYGALVMVPVYILNMVFGDGQPSTVSSIYNLLVTGPMTIGYITFAISIFRNRETSPAEVLYGFERFGKALGLYLLMSVLILLWTLLLVIPGIIAAFRYSMSFFILADNPDYRILEAINESKKDDARNNGSFSAWICLSSDGDFVHSDLGIGFLGFRLTWR
jgi:uncharacterized membrane protein